MLIIGEHSTPQLIIDDYPIFKINNVSSINITDHSLVKWNEYGLLVDDSGSSEKHHNYFNMYCVYDTAFGHWTLEVGIFLVIYKKLKIQIPDLQLYVPNFRFFKEAIINSFDISKDHIVNSIESTNNTFYFPERISHNCMTLNPRYEYYFNNFLDVFKSEVQNIEKDIDILYLPRGRKENFIGNDRRIINEDNIELFLKESYNADIYNSDNATNNFIDQVKLISRAKIIILTFGSAFFLNSIFLKDSHIIVLDKMENQFNYPYINFLYNYSLNYNTIDFIYSDNLYSMGYITKIINRYI